MRERLDNYESDVLRKNKDDLEGYVALNVVIVGPLLSNASRTSTAGNNADDPFEEPDDGDVIDE